MKLYKKAWTIVISFVRELDVILIDAESHNKMIADEICTL